MHSLQSAFIPSSINIYDVGCGYLPVKSSVGIFSDYAKIIKQDSSDEGETYGQLITLSVYYHLGNRLSSKRKLSWMCYVKNVERMRLEHNRIL